MFDRRHPARPAVDTDRLKSQAAEVGTALSSASVRAGEVAEVLAHQAKDAAEHAKDWAGPRVEKAWYEGRKAAAPRVEQVAEAALPVLDRTHDRLVDDLLPKLVAAINAAAAAAAVGADKARDVASARLTEMAHIAPPPPPKKSHTGAKVFWSIAGLAVIGALLAAFRRTRPTTDPWAEEPWEEGEHELAARTAAVRDGLGEAVDVVGKVAGEAVATARETSEKLAEKARETARKVTHKVEDAAGDTAEKVADAVDDAAEAVAEAAPTKPPARKRATPKQPESDADTPA
jgi:vacuolar-type H+-ATPase subunit H